MKCAFVASYYGPYYSNFVASVLAFEKKMQENGHSVFYVFPKEVEKFEWVELLRKYNNDIYFLEYAPHRISNVLSFRKIFKKEKADIIYSHMCGWDFTVRFAAPFKPIIWHMHMSVNVVNKVKRIKNWLKFNILGFGKTYHIAASELVAKAINETNPRNKCVSIYNALDFSRLNVNDNKTNDKCKRILLFGWEPIVKGLDIALDACEQLIKDGKNIRLLVSSQEKTYQYIKSKYTNQPEWLELLEPTNDVSKLYNAADIMLSSSRSEGFSYALAEAIYSGLVTVVSDIIGTNWSKEFLGRFEFVSGDSNSLKSALENALAYNITSSEKEYNKNKMHEKYSMDSWADLVYKEIDLIFKESKG